MEQFLDQYGYIALLVGTFFEGETAILVASSLTHTGLFEIPGTIIFGFAGSFISDWLYYIIGRVNGKYFIAKRPNLEKRVFPIKRFFHRHKIQLLLSYRFLYGFRVVLPVVMGMSGVRPLQYLGYSLCTGLFWASTVSAVGYWVGEFLEIKTDVFEKNIFFIVLGFAVFGIVVGYIVKRLAAKEMHVQS